ncbi:hypothetical protein N7447_007803 [Penicillium robsamsonii]|uniref:uncharacterized protein n=1 Tax=Penicillium robsamsonii TaxID=1792511 RepID=UPI002546AA8E|nr:uncharacterized protein N7447_007803 [Penicillium robsamsonii]KAJ5817795.1 hypothetical protein N7447_007803 [Penicillium robsamsonii]
MSFLDLPNEVILLVISYLEYGSDINALCCTTRWLHGLLNPILYKHSVTRLNGGYTLEWAAINGSASTTRLILEAGAPPDACEFEHWRPFALAALHGHIEIIELLYEKGINPLATVDDWRNPLGYQIDPEDRPEGHPLSMAASYGHISVVNLLLEYGVRPDLHTDNYEKRTALHFAAEHGHLDIVRVLADVGSPIDPQDQNGETPLAFAAQADHLDVVEFLLSRGADPNITTRYSGTSLCRASFSGNINIVRCLLEHGATPNPSYPDGQKPLLQLSRAALGGYDDILDLLLDRFDYVKSSTEPYQQAVLLCVAAITGRTTLLTDLLTKHNYDPDLRVTDDRIFYPYTAYLTPPTTALTWAAEFNQPAVIDILLSRGASITLPTDRPPALIRALQRGHKEATETLLAHGANPNELPGKGLSIVVNDPPLFSLLLSHNTDPTKRPFYNSRLITDILWSGNAETLRILLDHAEGLELVVDPLPTGNEVAPAWISLFHVALLGGQEVFRLLLDRGLLTPPTEPDDRTATRYLDFAICRGGSSFTSLLLDMGFDLHAGDNAGCLINRAARAEKDPEGVLDFLLQNGCSIDDTNWEGRTALFLAAYGKDENVMRRLLDRGADPLFDFLGVNVLSVAVKENDAGAVKVLLEVFDERGLDLGEIEVALKLAEQNVEHHRDIVNLLHRFYWRRRYPVSTSDDSSFVS